MCRSWRELSNAYLLAKIGVDTAENEPYFLKIPKPSKLFIIQVNPLFRSPPYPQGSSSRDVQASHIRDAQREERHLLEILIFLTDSSLDS